MPRLRRRLLRALILAFTASLYASNLDHVFQYDDAFVKIVNNPKLRDPFSYFHSFTAEGYSEDTTRLIPNLTFALNHAMSGDAPNPTADATRVNPVPFWFNLTNLFIHLVNVWLLSRLGRAVLRRLGCAGASGLPLLAAALFAVHPLNSEAVNYCNARPNMWVTVFYLWSLLLFLRAVDGAGRSPGTGVTRWGLFLLTFTLALLSKEFAVTIVVMIPLLLFWLGAAGEGRYRAFLRRRWWVCAGLGATGVGVVFLTGASAEVHRIVFSVGPQQTGHSATYLLLNAMGQSRVLIRYFGQALLPLPQFLNAAHHTPHLHELVFTDDGAAREGWVGVAAAPLACFAALLAVIAMALLLRRRAPFPSFFLLWPFLAHAPTSLVPRGEEIVEYRTYLPMIGVCLLLAWGIDGALGALARLGAARAEGTAHAPGPAQSRRRSILRVAVALPVLAALSLGTWARNPVWKTEVGFWADVVRPGKSSDWFRAWLNYGRTLEEAGRPDEAMAAYETSLRLRPGLWQAYHNRGFLLLRRAQGELIKGRIEDARKDLAGALEETERARRLGSTSPLTQRNMASIYELERRRDLEADVLREGLSRYPGFVPYYPMLHDLYAGMGRNDDAEAVRGLSDVAQLLSVGRTAEAAARAEAVAAGRPRSVEAAFVLGYVRVTALRRTALGEADLRRVIDLDPAHPCASEAMRLLADVYLRDGRRDDSARMYENLLARNADDFAAHVGLGRLFWGTDRERAEAHMRKAVELNPDHPLSEEIRTLLRGSGDPPPAPRP